MNAGKSPEGGVTRSTGEIPSITITNITTDGNLDFESDINFVPVDFYEEFNASKGGLILYDILIAKDGATTGKTAIIDDHFPFVEKTKGSPKVKAIFSEHVFRLRMKKGVVPLYIHSFLNSALGQLQLETVTSGGAQGGITTGFADEIYVPMVDEDIQMKIAQHWVARNLEIQKLRRSYEKTICAAKEEIDEMIQKSKPISAKSLASVLYIKGKIESNNSSINEESE